MVKPYIIRFISPHSSVGKTYVAKNVLVNLKNRGYVVGIIKHCIHGLDIEEKDSHIYLANGADVVIASSRDIGVVYYRPWIDSLENIINLINTPIIIVEGFKYSNIGEVVVVTRNMSEIETLKNVTNIIAYVVGDIDRFTNNLSIPIYTFHELDKLVEMIEHRALSFIYNQLPKTNCGYCGYESCKIFAEAYAKKITKECPIDLGIELIVNEKRIDLNPYVKKVLKSLIISFIDTLKDVPKDKKRIVVKINEERQSNAFSS